MRTGRRKLPKNDKLRAYLSELRFKSDKSIMEIADAADVSKEVISRFEHGSIEPSFEVIAAYVLLAGDKTSNVTKLTADHFVSHYADAIKVVRNRIAI